MYHWFIVLLTNITTTIPAANTSSGVANQLSIYELLYAFVGSFFGFLFALYTQWRFELINKKHKKKNVSDSIYLELTQVLKDIKPNFTEIEIYETPIWQSIVSTGFILEFLEYERSWYNDCFDIYHKVGKLRELEKYAYGNPVYYSKDVLEKRRELAKDINKFLTDYKKIKNPCLHGGA